MNLQSNLLIFAGLVEENTQTDDIIDHNSPYFCSSCSKPLPKSENNEEGSPKFINLRCGHMYCINCIQKFAKSQIDNEENTYLQCPICSNPLNDFEIDKIDPTYVPLLQKRILKNDEIISCPRCNTDFVLEPGQFDDKIKDMEGEQFRPEAIESYKKYKVSCPVCQTNFCAKCKMIPFHEALTCEEKKIFDEDIFCRFCTNYPPTGGRNIDVCHRVCWHANCQEAIKDACDHVCDCGHACNGVKGENDHFGCCLCQIDRSFCSYCKKQSSTKSSVVMRCGHCIHKECLIELYKHLDDKKRLIIPKCPFSDSCGQIPYHECVKDSAEKWIDYDKKINELIKMRMEYEDTKNDKRVKDPNDFYFGNPEKYARDKFIFYLCDKCKQPFFGGHYDCLQGNNDQNQDNNNNNNVDKGPHCCMRCNRELMNTVCPKHGEIGMVYKCMFCCEPALFFCWGNTYFCVNCHKDPHNVQNGPFPQCNGHCKFAPHPPNGQRVFIGYCTLCEQEKEDQLIYGNI